MKKRLDVLLVEKGLCTGRDKAKGFIMAGQVYVDSQKADKPGMEVQEDCRLELRGPTLPYVSRGGLKLEKAMEVFPIILRDAVCMDIGASTGGFTDCMLQNGAARVYAVDVGYGQLAWKLRNDQRVVVMERTNIRHVTRDQVDMELDFVSIDVSFISLKLVLPIAQSLMKEGAQAVCLIKPQFEAGRDRVGKKGVVRDLETHLDVVQTMVRFASQNGFCVRGLDFSPVKGPEGNIEYLLYLACREDEESAVDDAVIKVVVHRSHEALGERT